MASSPLIHENIWFEKPKYEAAERQYYERLAKVFQEKLNSVEWCDSIKSNDKKKAFIRKSEVFNNSINLTNDVPISASVSKDEKRSKKEKKSKNKDKKEAKKENPGSKLIESSTSTESKEHVNYSSGAVIDSQKNKSNGKIFGEMKVNANSPNTKNTVPKNLKGTLEESCVLKSQPSLTMKGHEVQCKSYVGHMNRLEDMCAEIWNVDHRRGFDKASSNSPMKQSLASEVAKARQHIKQSLECMDGIAAMAGSNVDLVNRINSLEKENSSLHKVVADLKNLVISLDSRVKSLEGGKSTTAPASNKPAKKVEEDDDDGVDLFGSDSEEESEEAAKVREARLAAYAEKKSKKPVLIAKSNIILSVSPWDDETDMKKLEECVRTIAMDGLVWGASKLVPLAYGIHKLHISCVVEDDKVSVDLLQEKIQEFEDYVQSVDIAAFNKV